MKRVFSALFVWGVIGLMQSLSADVVYHLSILVDPNLNDSIALVNVFPGNSSVSVTNPDSGRSEVFTVQQRDTVGRKIVLSPGAAGRLGLGEGSIAGVRIVELALDDGNSSQSVNPAAEYQDIVAGPGESRDVFARPAPKPRTTITTESADPYSPAKATSTQVTPLGVVGDLPQTNASPQPDRSNLLSEPSVTGLPPKNQAPVVREPTNETGGLGPDGLGTNSSRDGTLLINTRDENLRIPIPTKEDELVAQRPSPNPLSKDGIPSDENGDKELVEPLKTRIPAGDPFTARSGGSKDSDSKSQGIVNPVLSVNPAPNQKLPVETDDPKDGIPIDENGGKELPEPLKTRIPAGDPFTARSGGSKDSDSKSQGIANPVLSVNPTPNQKSPAETDDVPEVAVISPSANSNWRRGAESKEEISQSSLVPKNSPEATNSKPVEIQIQRPMGDAKPVSRRGGTSDSSLVPRDKTSTPQNKTLVPRDKNKVKEPSVVGSIPKGPEIYFPTIGDMKPPPSSRSSDLSNWSRTGELVAPSGDNPNSGDNPKTQSKLPNLEVQAHDNLARQSVVVKGLQVIGRLNNLDLPQGYYIQIASFRDVRKTKKVYQKFVNEYKMNVIPAEVNGLKYYRCLIGNLDESEVAEVLRKVRSSGYEDAFVYKNS